MEYANVKTCDTCDKRRVCKFMVNRKEIEDAISDIVSPIAFEDAPFNISVSCNEHEHNIKKRGI